MLFYLPILLLIPFISALVAYAAGDKHSYAVSLIASSILFIFVIFLLYQIHLSGLSSLSFSVKYIPGLNAGFSLQLTEYTVILLVMLAIVFLAASIVGNYFVGRENGRLYNTIFLFVEGGALGVFLSSNLLLFYIFWEMSEVMVFLLIFIFGGYDRKYASIKFILYSIMSSLLILIGIMLLYSATGTFNILSIISKSAGIAATTQLGIMVLFLIGFMIKFPIFPLHSWLPDAYSESSTPTAMVLAGALSKFGGYGLILTVLLLPVMRHYAVYLAAFAGFSAIYAAFVALRQTHIKRLIAYTSMADVGIIAIGIAAANTLGISGALYGMLSHGIAISILFLLIGGIEKIYGTAEINRLTGLVKNVPQITYMFLIGVLITIGTPLTTGFVADLLIFFGSFAAFGINGLIPIFAIIIVAAYLFWTMEKVFFKVRSVREPYYAIGRSVIYAGILLILFSIFFGVLPSILMSLSGL